MDEHLRQGGVVLGVSTADMSACFKLLYSEVAGPAIFLGKILEGLDYVLVTALAKQVFGRLVESDHRHAGYAHDEDEGSAGVV